MALALVRSAASSAASYGVGVRNTPIATAPARGPRNSPTLKEVYAEVLDGHEATDQQRHADKMARFSAGEAKLATI
jgi:hypothetical protein